MRRLRKSQGVLAYPTESCFGLGCDPFDARKVRRILHIKQRPARKGLILIAATPAQLAPFVETAALQAARATGAWPGPVTFILPASLRCPVWIRGQHRGVAVRVTAHPPARRACLQYGGALVSTSANRAGQRPVRSARELDRRFGGMVERWPGRIGRARRPSRIVDLASGRILRS